MTSYISNKDLDCLNGSFQRISINSKSQKYDNEDDKDKNATTNYAGCLAGSSMVRYINPNIIFGDRKFLSKSIGGGRILDLLDFIMFQKTNLQNCKLFLFTIGSNDCDSIRDIRYVIEDMRRLLDYMNHTYRGITLIINKLVPREKTKYTQLDEFDSKRIEFNQFIETDASKLLNKSRLIVVDHAYFEVKENLPKLLYDGVHMRPFSGVSVYVKEIKKAIKDLVLD